MNNETICNKVTEKLLAMIEAGVNPWRKPWTASGAEAAISHTTGKEYSLLNQCLLGFRPGEYLTFNQVKAEGGSVKKGAKAGMVVFWASQTRRTKKVTDEETGEEKTITVTTEFNFPVLKCYNVFHISDCDGIKPKFTKDVDAVKSYDFETDTEAEDVAAEYCKRSGVKLFVEDGDRAYYRPATDEVHVPSREQFGNAAEFYGTLYHELTHSTGHKSRFNRLNSVASFGDKEYSREELVAEIGAATSLAKLGINTEDTEANSAAYLKGWASFLKSDNKAFIVAAGKAEKAVKMIFNENE